MPAASASWNTPQDSSRFPPSSRRHHALAVARDRVGQPRCHLPRRQAAEPFELCEVTLNTEGWLTASNSGLSTTDLAALGNARLVTTNGFQNVHPIP